MELEKWMSGEWVCKKQYIKQIKETCMELIGKIGCRYIITYVPGHSGIYGNDRADELAKSQIDRSDFNELIELL